MKQSTVAVDGPVTVVIDNIDGDLQVAGWERPEVSAKTDGDEFQLSVESGQAHIHCDGDLIVYMPREASLQAGNVSGDADIRGLVGTTHIENVSGDLQMRGVSETNLSNISGDLSVRSCAGDFQAENVGGDASLRDVQGALSLNSVGGDLFLRNLPSDVKATTGGDAVLYLQPHPGASVRVSAGSDILLRLPPAADAELNLQGSSLESIRVDFPGVSPVEEGASRHLILGAGAAKINLIAGDDLIVTSRADEWQSMADFDNGGLDDMFAGGFPGLPADFHERISERVQEATQRAMKVAERGQHISERAQRRVDAAMRRAEEKMRAAERRSQFLVIGGQRVSRPGPIPPVPPIPPIPPIAPVPPAPRSEPVSDEERLTILKMLQDKKISLQDAEKLLAALEGK
jgi:hypothetical protein